MVRNFFREKHLLKAFLLGATAFSIADACRSARAQDAPLQPYELEAPYYVPQENGGYQEWQQEQQPRAASLADLDRIMESAMQQLAVPGASLAVAKDGQLVYAKGFGFANLQTGERATPSTLFNLASCTKAVSTLGILTLVDAGQLNLDAPVYEVVGRPPLPNPPDPRMYQVTIRQLLHHSAGWNDDGGYARASKRLHNMAPQGGIPYGQALPVLLATPLDYTPGTDAKYANGDWNMLKYVIEVVSGQPYGAFMRGVLSRIGIYDMVGERKMYLPGEAARYTGRPPRELPSGKSAVPLDPSFGNWMASSVDMVKVLTAIDGTRCQPPISPAAYQAMLAPLPPPMVNRPNGSHYGLGLDAVKVTQKGVFYTKNGGKPGAHTQIEHLPNNVDYAVMFNGGADQNGARANPLDTVLPQLRQTLSNITEWGAPPGGAPMYR